MTNGLLTYGNHFLIYKEAIPQIRVCMTLQLLHSEFPYIWGKSDFFYQCTRLFTLDIIGELKKWSTFQIRNWSKSLLLASQDGMRHKHLNRLTPRTLGNGVTLAVDSGESFRYPFSLQIWIYAKWKVRLSIGVIIISWQVPGKAVEQNYIWF
jgi:hypothetical protein